MQVVSVETKFGGISFGKLDDHGRLVELGGTWYPERDPDKLDKLLRQHVQKNSLRRRREIQTSPQDPRILR